MNDRLTQLVNRLDGGDGNPRVDQNDPEAMRAFLASIELSDAVALVEAGYLSVERIDHLGDVHDPTVGIRRLEVNPELARSVTEVIKRNHEQATTAAQVDSLLKAANVGIATCLAGIDDPDAAVETLGRTAYSQEDEDGKSRPLTIDERDDVALDDGYLYVVGVTSEALQEALVATRHAR